MPIKFSRKDRAAPFKALEEAGPGAPSIVPAIIAAPPARFRKSRREEFSGIGGFEGLSRSFIRISPPKVSPKDQAPPCTAAGSAKPDAALRVIFYIENSMSEKRSFRVELERLQQDVISCTRCPRLVHYREKVAREKKRMYQDQEYWGRPLPSFGDPNAKLLILGLAPAAHGGNRTGRMFTGDRSGDFLYRGLYEAGFANQPQSICRNDGLELRGCYITASLRCAPPANKPTPEELRRCRPYLIRELQLLKRVRAVLALGRIAFDSYLRILYEGFWPDSDSAERIISELPPRSTLRFMHGACYTLPGDLPRLFASYHPSQQNTQTGKLRPEMFQSVLREIRRYLRLPEPAS